MSNLIQVGGKIYQEVTTPPPSVPIKKTKPKHKPKSKTRLKIEFWALFGIAGVALILWAISIIKSDWNNTTSAGTGQRTHMRNN